jgi:hypothetical protein
LCSRYRLRSCWQFSCSSNINLKIRKYFQLSACIFKKRVYININLMAS